jgi:hypothetical protein
MAGENPHYVKPAILWSKGAGAAPAACPEIDATAEAAESLHISLLGLRGPPVTG